MAVNYESLFTLLKSRNISLTKLTEDIRVSTATIAKLRKGDYVSLQTVEKIAHYLNVQIGDVLDFSTNKVVPKVLIADFDRTLAYLYKDEALLRVLAKEILEHYAKYIEISDKKEKAKQDGYFVWFSLHNETLTKLGTRAAKINEEAEEIVTQFEMRILSEINLIDGIKEAVIDLDASGVKLAIVSNNASRALKYSLHRTGIDYLFAYIGGRAYPFAPELLKPNPYPLLVALGHLAVNTSDEVWYVGDDISDMVAAKNAMIKPVGVYSGRHNEEELVKAGASLTFANFNELAKYITKV